MGTRRILWVAIALVVACTPEGQLRQRNPGVGVPAPSPLIRAMLERTNAERARVGVPELREEPRLMRAARIHADQLARARRLGHELEGVRYPTLPDRLRAVDYAWAAIGENIAAGQSDAAAVVGDWMRSRGHRGNILNRSFTEFGVASSDGGGQRYYVQVFARPSARR